MLLAYTAETLDGIVKPEKMDSWAVSKKLWFSSECSNDCTENKCALSCITSQKTPVMIENYYDDSQFNVKFQRLKFQSMKGLLKTEKKIREGHFVGLSPKCYIMEGEGKRKVSHKGVPKKIKMTIGQYLRSLYDNDPGFVSFAHIAISKANQQATTRVTRKRALNSLLLILHVHENKVTVRPHHINSKFL